MMRVNVQVGCRRLWIVLCVLVATIEGLFAGHRGACTLSALFHILWPCEHPINELLNEEGARLSGGEEEGELQLKDHRCGYIGRPQLAPAHSEPIKGACVSLEFCAILRLLRSTVFKPVRWGRCQCK